MAGTLIDDRVVEGATALMVAALRDQNPAVTWAFLKAEANKKLSQESSLNDDPFENL